MKKLLIISLAIVGLGFVSCQKEELTQNSGSGMELPVWEDGARVGDGNDDNGLDGNVEGITDPNDENDGPTNGKQNNGKTRKQ